MTRTVQMRSIGWLLASATALLAAVGCADDDGDVTRRDSGLTEVECASASSAEKNCMFCASKPGCGWCSEPSAGAERCQPGTSTDKEPDTCEVALAISTEDCDAPPPPAKGDAGS